MHPGQKLKPGARVVFEGDSHASTARCSSGDSSAAASSACGPTTARPLDEAVDAIGHVPLPPYIKRDDRARRPRALPDRVRARARIGRRADRRPALHAGAASTRLRARGVEIAEITLHVGYGTFQPVRVERVEDTRSSRALRDRRRRPPRRSTRARDDGRRVIAVGTTTTRTLEAVARATRRRDRRRHAARPICSSIRASSSASSAAC